MVTFWIIIGVLVFFLLASAGWASFSAAPWVPTWARDFSRIRALAAVQPGDTIFELGAGEGRLLRVFTQTQARSIIGYEISFIPFVIAWLRMRRQAPRVQVRCQDFFTAHFAGAQVIFCFLTPPAMRKLKVKFEAECKPGTRIISYAFTIPGWQPDCIDKPTRSAMAIYRYIVH